MKKIKSGVLVLSILLMLTGCIKSNTDLVINDDKSMNLTMDALISDQVLAPLATLAGEEDIIDSMIKEAKESDEFKNSGITLEKTTRDGYSGIKISADWENIDDLSEENKDVRVDFAQLAESMSTDEATDVKLFKVKKGFLKNTYTADFYIKADTDEIMGGVSNGDVDETITSTTGDISEPIVDENTSTSDMSGMLGDLSTIFGSDMEQLMTLAKEIEINFSVKVPRKNISTNSKNVSEDGKELKWDLSNSLTSGETSIKFEFDIINKTNLYILIGGVAGVIIILIIIIVLISKGKKKKAAAAEEPIHTDFDANNNSSLVTEENANMQTTEISSPTEVVNDVTNAVDNTVATTESNFVSSTTEFVESEPVGEVNTTMNIMPTAETAPVMESAPVMETTPTVEAAPVMESAPVMETTPTVEAAPVMESAPVMETTPTVEAAPVMESAPVMETTPTVEVSPVMESAQMMETTPTVEAAPVVADVTMPEPSASYEFTLPEETASVNAQVTIAPEEKGPMFVTETPEVQTVETPVVEQVTVDAPDTIDMNNQSIQ
ncbi:MAG: hypothetical protein ACI33S_05485 [Bacilli bacterium]